MNPLPQPLILLQNQYRCLYCKRPFVRKAKGSYNGRTKDHIIPRSKGGNSSQYNLVWACGRCNQYKADLEPSEFKMKLMHNYELEDIPRTLIFGVLDEVIVYVNENRALLIFEDVT
jgi:hypothetical protein